MQRSRRVIEPCKANADIDMMSLREELTDLIHRQLDEVKWTNTRGNHIRGSTFDISYHQEQYLAKRK
jgi:hypothetical protein